MDSVVSRIVVAGVLFFLLSAAWALPRDDGLSPKEARSPAVDEDLPTYDDDQGSSFSLGNLISGRVGKFFTDFIQASSQLPATVFRLVSGLVASQPLAKLREEVRNLNISYPK